MTQTRCSGRLRACALALGATLMLGPIVSYGEDIDIYAPPRDAEFAPSIMFMLDSSDSMNFNARLWTPKRADQLKRPLQDFVRGADGVRIGLSSFNGKERGGAILYPASDPSEDLCPGNACGEITVRTQSRSYRDDALEDLSSGTVNTTLPGHWLGQKITPYGSAGFYLDRPGQVGQSVMATGPGQAPVDVPVLPLFQTEGGKTTTVGIHFPKIFIREDQRVYYSDLRFEWSGHEWLDSEAGDGSGDVHAIVRVDTREDSPPFADAPGQRLDDRPLSEDFIKWTIRRPAAGSGGADSSRRVTLPNITSLFNQVRPMNDEGPLTLVIEPDPDYTHDREHTINLLGVHDRDPQEASSPFLYYGFEDMTPDVKERRSAVRFPGVQVPRGARITAARVEFLPRHNADDTDADFTIAIEDVGSAEEYTTGNSSLSDVALAPPRVSWQPDRWSGNPGRKPTSDISSLIQHAVDREDWCAGNAVSLLIDGSGERFIYNFIMGAWTAPSLHVSYDSASVGAEDTCRAGDGAARLLLAASDDRIERIRPSFEVVTPTPDLWTGKPEGEEYHYGLHFDDLDIEPGERIIEATLELTVSDESDVHTSLEIVIDHDATDGDLSGGASLEQRVVGGPSMDWPTGRVTGGVRIASPNLSKLLQPMIDEQQWVSGQGLTLRIRDRYTGRNVRFVTAAAGGADGPRLRITKAVTGAAAAARPLRTARDEMIEAIDTLPATGNTPLVDAFYESSRYLLGGDVEYGAYRGEGGASNKLHRLSAPSTYTGGTLVRDSACDPEQPNTLECVTERITGVATYIAPPTSECRANRIVLVTDGAPSESQAGAGGRIRSMTGDAGCEDAGPGACATELAAWLAAGDGARRSVRTDTIGFGFSSGFLDDIASAGGGSSYTATSSSALENALQRIGGTVHHDPSAFAAPSAGVSQFDRYSNQDRLYFSTFEPSPGRPLWPGNLKSYRLGPLENGEIVLLDADGMPALDPETDQFDDGARSFWSLAPDGRDVKSGGAASRLQRSRNMLTWSDDGPLPGARELEPFDVGTAWLDHAILGTSAEARDEAIRLYRGEDVHDEDGDTITDEPRRSMGAAMHTSARVLNFLSEGKPEKSVVFVGTQEGLLHAIDTRTGVELSAIVPPELLGNVGAFHRNEVGPMRHGLDGPITVWMQDTNSDGAVDPDATGDDAERALLAVGMRRGGDAAYVFDVTDPVNPEILYTVGAENETPALGDTWSAFQGTKIYSGDTGPGGSAVARDVLVFAAGYDEANDADWTSERAEIGKTTRGSAIYVIDAITGETLITIDPPGMDFSIPSDLAVIDANFDGFADLLLVGDMGGNLWRVDLAPGQVNARRTETTATTTLVATFGDPGVEADDRRFFHAPDAILVRDAQGETELGVTIGSGRRDQPAGTATNDRLYALHMPLEADAMWTVPVDHDDLEDASEGPVAGEPDSVGWYMDLARPGEKILGSPVILDDAILVTSYVPAENAGSPCHPALGTGRLYAVAFRDASASVTELSSEPGDGRSVELASPGIPPEVAVVISEYAPERPVALVGTEMIDGLEASPSEIRTYYTAD